MRIGGGDEGSDIGEGTGIPVMRSPGAGAAFRPDHGQGPTLRLRAQKKVGFAPAPGRYISRLHAASEDT